MCHKSKKFSILSVQFFFLEIWFLTNEHFSAHSQYVQKGPKSNKSEIKMSCNVQLPCFFCHGQDQKDQPWPSGTLFASCCCCSQPSECGLQHTLNSIHGHTAAWLKSNGYLAVWISQSGENALSWLYQQYIISQSGENVLSWLYQQYIWSQCNIKDPRYCVGS